MLRAPKYLWIKWNKRENLKIKDFWFSYVALRATNQCTFVDSSKMNVKGPSVMNEGFIPEARSWHGTFVTFYSLVPCESGDPFSKHILIGPLHNSCFCNKNFTICSLYEQKFLFYNELIKTRTLIRKGAIVC